MFISSSTAASAPFGLAQTDKLGQVSYRPPKPFAIVSATVLGLPGIAMVALYMFPELQTTTRQVAMWSSFIPYGIASWAAAALVLAFAGRGGGRLFALIPLTGLLVNAVVLVPYVDPTNTAPAGTQPTLRVMALNLHYGQADTAALLTEVQRIQPDVLVLTEFTDQAQSVLTDPAWRELLPYHLGTTGRATHSPWVGDSSGTQVLSTTPLTEVGRTTGTGATNLAVSLTANGHSLTLIAAHPMNPVRGRVEGWLSDADAVTQLAQRFEGQPLVLAGDLNSVPEHVTFRRLISATGLHQTEQGWQPTYPADRMVPLITIDHVLASSDFRTVSVHRFRVADTDHLGNVVELAQS
jgi:endonuclease/exonuclease/phosphatase (EEP) superfamily protein YafD